MVFATSDLHGYPLDGFKRLLDAAGFADDDFLYVLGDVVDRNGDGGVAMLRWMAEQPNIELILGNHEAMLLSCAFLFEEVTELSLSRLTPDNLGALSVWMNNGAQPTLNALRQLVARRPDALEDLMDYLRDAPLYETLCLGERDFLLVHSGLENFSPERPLSDYAADELLWCRPTPETRYFDSALTVLGHTPTRYFGCDGRAFQTDTWIDIDVGAGAGGPPMLLRLDDMRPFYVN